MFIVPHRAAAGTGLVLRRPRGSSEPWLALRLIPGAVRSMDAERRRDEDPEAVLRLRGLRRLIE